MMNLNDEQLRAIYAPSPTLVIASAGSGKTRCLISKIMHLLDSGVDPSHVCAVTFTNKAADEMKTRLRKHYDITGMQISTIHSMCVRIIRIYIQHTPLKAPFTIYDDGNQLSIIKTILKSRNIKDNPYDVLSLISKVKSDMSESRLKGDMIDVYEQYQKILIKNNACDFDDLLLYASRCLNHDDCRNHFINTWHYLLVDEFQDTSTIQYDIIKKLYNFRNNCLFAVGDENQSIYGWRGAQPNNINDFREKLNPSVCYLTYNYRSCPEVINFSNGYLQYGKQMVSKSNNKGQVSLTKFGSYEEEAEKIAQALRVMRNFEETAILYRVNSRSLLFEQAFTRHSIPYKVVGDKPFYQRRVVRDILSYLRASVNEHDIESMNRIINVPRRGFGDAKKEKLLVEGREYVEQISSEMPSIESFLSLLDDIKKMSPFQAISEILSRTGYRTDLKKESDIFMVDALLDVSKSFKTLEELILASTFIEKDSGRGVKLMTAHASKGLEFDRVFVVGVEDGIWPHKLSLDVDEEKRLFYVSCTRARKYLNISYARSRTYRGKPMQMYPSMLFRSSYEMLFKKKMK